MQSSFMSEYGTNFLLFAQWVDVISDGVFNFESTCIFTSFSIFLSISHRFPIRPEVYDICT